jgi:type VI protein secretion system component VasF
VYSISIQNLTPAEAAERRRRIRRTALWLTAFAVVVYVVFIVSFIKTHQ